MRRTRLTERRGEERYPQSIEVLLQQLPDLESSEPFKLSDISGRTQNISHKGLCIITSEPIRSSSLIRCEIGVCDYSEVRITTLMRVRWTRKRIQDSDGFISGLEALL
jgi:PilZ domain